MCFFRAVPKVWNFFFFSKRAHRKRVIYFFGGCLWNSNFLLILRFPVGIGVRTEVPFWGQTAWNMSRLSPKQDCSSKRANSSRKHIQTFFCCSDGRENWLCHPLPLFSTVGGLGVVFTWNRYFYPTTSVHPVSVPIRYPREIRTIPW